MAIDVYHVWWDTHLERELMGRGRGRVIGFHLCDWKRNTTDILLDRGMMGDGVADISSIRQAVFDTGFDRMEEVEVFSKSDWWQRDPAEVIAVAGERFKAIQEGRLRKKKA